MTLLTCLGGHIVKAASSDQGEDPTCEPACVQMTSTISLKTPSSLKQDQGVRLLVALFDAQYDSRTDTFRVSPVDK